jgi:hypothetical protein
MAKIADDEGLRNVLDAHGGLDYWRSLSAIDLEYSAWGLLFTAKRISPLRHAHLTISTQEPDVVLHDYPVPGQSGVLHGAELVEIRDSAGSVLQTRTNPREAFGHWRRLFRWDAMDFAYFSNYAMWNYLTLPFLLLHPAVTVEASENAAPVGVTRLKVGFPTTLPTHSPTQELYFDPSGRLFRHDYTAEVVGSWAKAVHLCDRYRQFGGLWLPTKRRVYPKGPFNRALPFPTLVAIDIHFAHPVSANAKQ